MINENEAQNQHQQVLYYLYTLDSFSLKDVINDSMFFKFQTRLSDIEIKYKKTIATRTWVKFVNKFGNDSSFYKYKAIDKQQIKELFYTYK